MTNYTTNLISVTYYYVIRASIILKTVSDSPQSQSRRTHSFGSDRVDPHKRLDIAELSGWLWMYIDLDKMDLSSLAACPT